MSLDKSGKIKLFQQVTGWSTDKMRANAKVVNAICEGEGVANAITYDEQDLTEEQKAQARENIGATAPEVFVAEYGVTTYAEIKAALDANKVVLVKYIFDEGTADESVSYFGNPYEILDAIVFNFIHFSFNDSNIHTIGVNQENLWVNVGAEHFQNINEKSQSIQTDKNSITKYPSTKAVSDALGGKNLWTGTAAQYAQLTPSNDIIYFITP